MGISVERIKEIWYNFRTSQDSSDNPKISGLIRASWERSAAYGIDPFLKEAPIVVSGEELERRRKINRELIDNSVLTMKRLHAFVAGSGFVVALTDNDGVILEIIGDDEAIAFTRPGKFIEGSKWAEEVAGTNAIGLALVERNPVQVFGYEHYALCAFHTTCSAAPIHDPDNKIIGVLDITGAFERVNNHTLGMVVAACNAIENQIVLQRACLASELANLHKDVIMESIIDGVLAVDNSGKVTHLNRVAGKLLKLDPKYSIGRNISSLLGLQDGRNKYFVDLLCRSVNITDEVITITLEGEKVKAVISCRPLVSRDGIKYGSVVVLRENKRVAKMVTQMIGAHARIRFDDILGGNLQLAQIIQTCKNAASSQSNILLLGESGTGKDLFAQAIHNASPRSEQPFVAVNCAAIPRELIASELFGYEDGAFTGARKGGNPGKFELADQGTLFLDEIGEMPLDLQSSLLRVLEDRTIVRLGGREPIPVDVRIVAATNKQLKQEIEKGNFRSDLYYRINVVTVEIPPLRHRRDDIELLSRLFLGRISERLGRAVSEFDSEVLMVFNDYDWPGNIRELQNTIERAVHVAQFKSISMKDIPNELLSSVKSRAVDISDTAAISAKSSEKQLFKVIEEKVIREYLDRYRSKKRVAEELGIARSTLYRKFEEYGIKPE